MNFDSAHLPIEAIKSELAKVLQAQSDFVLTAPTGSGKSTAVPNWILDWLPHSTIYVLQPRRLPARMLAQFVAKSRQTTLGDEVGYQVRFDAKISKKTRLIYVTEGLLLRKLLDPRKNLNGHCCFLFDEFHERHLEGDLALALAKEAKRLVPDQIQIGVLSATLEAEPVSTYLGGAPIIKGDGRQYPVSQYYLGTFGREMIWEQVEAGLQKAINDGAETDILVFLPGKYEILKTQAQLSQSLKWKSFDILPLFGDLPPAEQDKVMEPGNRPRIILSTNIAETSLTLPRLKTVIDAGLARIPSFDPRRGINAIGTCKISRASADQRAGRAGRLSAGRCYRLWSEKDHSYREASTPPEIKRLDLSEMLLQLGAAGFDPDHFPYYDAPETITMERGKQLLHDLGAWKNERITPLGQQMARFPLHPRFRRLLLAGVEMQCLSPILLIIALAQSRSIWQPAGQFVKKMGKQLPAELESSDFLVQLYAWQLAAKEQFNLGFCREYGIHGQACRTVGQVYHQLCQIAKKEELLQHTDNSENRVDTESIRKCLLFGFADQVGIRTSRGTLHCRLTHQKAGTIAPQSIVNPPSLLVSAELEEREYRGERTVFLQNNTEIEESWLQEAFPDDFHEKLNVALNTTSRKVEAVQQKVFRDLVIAEKPTDHPDPAQAAPLLARAVLEENWILKKWDHAVETWIRRCNILATHAPELELKPITEEDRLFIIEQICDGATSYKEIKDREVMPVLKQWIPDSLLPLLDEWVPVRFDLSSGFSPKLRYEADGTVVLSAKIQQFYDVPGNSLRICQNKCPLKIEILAPNFRPVQITDNLDTFWKNSYPSIKKDLFGRYPKHEWR